ncbi:MAG: bifunctional DNA-formamidopyrimidine glycosylase/DNA-(apurinic or apyrimidinic site) lyase [Gemmatimonadota bacterium]
MPELPEAETIVRGLRSAVVGERIRRTRVLHPDVLREARRTFGARLRGRQIVGVERRGKNVIHRMDDGSVLAVNLGMTGRLLPFAVPPRGSARPTHPAVRFSFESGGTLIFDDQRRFGTVERMSGEAWEHRSARMGPEPLDPSFTAEDLHQLLARSRSPVRSWLLDQRRIAGVGNIYAAEALYLAGIHPARPANRITLPEAHRLHERLRRVLRAAIDQGGTTIRDYRNAEGEAGTYGRRLHVYGREGEPCPACGTPVLRIVFSNRSAFFCPSCQPGPRRPRV